MLLRTGPHRPLTVRGELDVLAILATAAHITQQARLAALDFSSPHLLFRLSQFAPRVRDMATLTDLGAARIDYGLAVWSEIDGKDVLAVIALVAGHLSRFEAGCSSDPDVALALAVEYPGDAIGLGRRGQTTGKGRTHDLLQSESLFLT